ncbi:MAG TPA: hypothetical protein ENN80_04015 [Candidatus Hydrogenedentes bacterium]|nr:hypothetical protein [Candidatus Hydrogenedentota bacterium]
MSKGTKMGLGVAVGGVAIAVLVWIMFRVFSQPYEEVMAVNALNNYAPIVQRGGHVKAVRLILDKGERIAYVNDLDGMTAASKKEHIEKIEKGIVRPDDAPFVANVLDSEGAVVGRVRGYRMAGVGTIISECVWLEGVN